MPQISVIVPVYKVEPYLRRCVDSILGQTFTDFELILVDDGSPDGCPAICDEYAARDPRVVVIHQKNSGLSAARNAGIDWAFANSDSQRLSFIDSDDWVHPDYLRLLLEAAEKYHTAVSICSYKQTSGEEPVVDLDSVAAHLWDTEKYYVEHTQFATIAWGKLYEKSCFAQVRYPVGKLHEDEFVTYKLLFAHKKLAVVDLPLYFYFQSTNSITTSAWTPRRMAAIEALEEQLSYFADNGFHDAQKRRVRSFLWLLCSQYHGAKTADADYQEECRYLLRKMRSVMRTYASQIDHTWPEYTTVLELLHPHLHRFYILIHKIF